MTKTPSPSAGDAISGWTLQEKLGEGGNGSVWRASRQGYDDHAMKLLIRTGQKARDRFESEVVSLLHASGIDGVVPIIDSEISSVKGEYSWYTMPLASKSLEAIKSKNVVEKVAALIPLALTLSNLHARDIVHRDIKPDNIVLLNNRLCFCDFGLAKFPSREDITSDHEDVGAKFTIAPEMRRDAKSANAKAADVFSFAKTIWMFIKEDKLGFDGQYRSDGTLALYRHCPGVFIAPLDDLLEQCTSHDPEVRPSMKDVVLTLLDWVRLKSDYHDSNIIEWHVVQSGIFPFGIPASCVWREVDQIIAILKLASRDHTVNHMFFPTGGGHAINSVRFTSEPGVICLETSNSVYIKPNRLVFRSFQNMPEWSYFMLECDEIELTQTKGSYIRDDGYCEELYEISPGVYRGIEEIEYEYFEDLNIRGEPIPVSRYLKGNFLIVCTRSPYNLESGTYDARHEKISEEEFYEYMSECCLGIKALKNRR